MSDKDEQSLEARLPYLSITDMRPEYQDVLERDINLFRILAHSPLAARRFNSVGRFIRYESKLPPRLRQLAILQVGYCARSRYEYSHHVKISREFGLSDADIGAVAIETAGGKSTLDDLARDVLSAAREITVDGKLATPVFDRLSAELSPELMVDLVVTISFYNAVIRILNALKIDVEPEYLKYLVEFPLPDEVAPNSSNNA